MTGRFYRYIHQHHNGYQIRKDGIHYGWYDNIYDALFDRDRLEQCQWDLEEFVWLPERPNKYLGIPLPPRELDRYRQYIYPSAHGGFRIQKTINGKVKYFGTYKSLDEAIQKRDELIRNDWK